MDQVAQWVRFADVKATVLFASLGVVLTALISNSQHMVEAAHVDVWQQCVVIGLAVATGLLALFTLLNLTWAVAPSTSRVGVENNRFAWPSLAASSASAVQRRAVKTDAATDAWHQTVVLARLARKKYAAIRRAVWGLTALVVVAMSLIAFSVVATVQSSPPSHPRHAAPSTHR